MTEPITSYEELQNIIALGFDIWVVAYDYRGDAFAPFKIARPVISQGVRGPMLSNNFIKPEYLKLMSIEDHHCHHSVRTFGKRLYKLFNSEEDAKAWRRSKHVRH